MNHSSHRFSPEASPPWIRSANSLHGSSPTAFNPGATSILKWRFGVPSELENSPVETKDGHAVLIWDEDEQAAPLELAEKVISYYSFENDVVLDPFAGIGTVGTAALDLGRRFYLIERERMYIDRFLEVERARFEKTWLTGVIQGQDRLTGKTPVLVG